MRVTEQAKAVVREVVMAGETVVDGTLGNGYDALFLAELVGTEGRVVGFDVQSAAIASARERLEAAGVMGRCELVEAGHERMGEFVEGEVGAAMFNLGYLPGSDKGCITRGETTVAALEAAVSLLREGGVVTVMCYLGHEGGVEEAEAVLEWARGLTTGFVAEGPEVVPEQSGPFLLVVRRRERA